MMKERDLISTIHKQFSSHSDYLLQGIGDDCAVIADSDSLCWLMSTDLLVENIHFVAEWHKPKVFGRKSIAVNLSDIAAMGGRPRFALISLVLPPHFSDEWLQKWHEGVKSMMDEFSCFLIGGDISKGSQFVVNVTVVGSAHPDNVIYRSGASPEQDIYVTGYLGSSAAGLEILKKGLRNDRKYQALIQAHLDPVPQISIGLKLAESGLISSMQDISDGVATDLSHICTASNVSAVIEADKIPMDELLRSSEKVIDTAILDLALSGGEDYQLIFTANKENSKKLHTIALESGVILTKIGETSEGPPKVFLVEEGQKREISFKGYEHA